MTRLFTPAIVLALLMPVFGPLQADWHVGPEVMAGQGGEVIRGVVFEDRDGDGRHGEDEPGIAGVLVTNGLDVVVTDDRGHYEIAVREDMDLSVVQPSGWQVPVDRRRVPQFHYSHKPGGSTETLRFGGLPDTGPAPERVNFPLRRSSASERFDCAIVGDPQTYSNDEIGFFRHGVVTDLLDEGLGADDCMIYVGDVVGDDLELLDRLMSVGSSVGVPQWLVIGNHDLDLDATRRENASDTWRRIAAPSHYAFEIGQVTFITLNNMVFPCGERDAQRTGREFCLDERTQYNGRISDEQMQWLGNLLEQVPEDRLLVFLHHVPLVSFTDAASPRHQTDNAAKLYELVGERPALSLSGHTHTVENLAPGEGFAEWRESVGIGSVPFRHIIAGAASGAWWQGDFDIDGIPMALQRMGAPKGVLMLAFDGADYVERYRGTRIDPERGQWVSLNTPAFREWFERIAAWKNDPGPDPHPTPPLSIHDLGDNSLVTVDDLADGVYVTANVWAGSRETTVEARINGGEPFALERTQAGDGEAVLEGAPYADPSSFMRTLTVARVAIESREGDARTQGYETFQGRPNRGVPQPQGRRVTGRNVHLWRARLPENLSTGAHVLEVVSTDRHGHTLTDRLVFEVHEEHPPRFWRHEIW
jgi:hypothetical protein